MPEKSRALFRGATNEAGEPLEWLGVEPPLEEGGEMTQAVPPRHLTQEEYDALSPRNKERVKEAKNAAGEPLYDVRTEREVKGKGGAEE